MAIRIITGKPGSGKTFYAVKHLRDKYYKNKNGAWIKDNNITIISNIKNLTLKHKNLEEILKSEDVTIHEFFTVTYQKKYTENKNVVYFIDECQQYFDKRFYNKEVFYYFQTHRHLGHDIYLITQNIQLIPIQIKEVAEIEIHAVPRNISFFGEFKYTIKSNNEAIDKELLKKDNRIFRLYTSFSRKENERIKNPLVKYVGIAFALLLIASIVFYKTFFGVAEARENYTIEPNLKLKQTKIEDVKYFPPPVIEESKIELIPVRLDYVITKNEIWVIDPITNIIIPIRKLPYKFAIDRYGKRIEIVAMIRKDLVKKETQTSTNKKY